MLVALEVGMQRIADPASSHMAFCARDTPDRPALLPTLIDDVVVEPRAVQADRAVVPIPTANSISRRVPRFIQKPKFSTKVEK